MLACNRLRGCWPKQRADEVAGKRLKAAKLSAAAARIACQTLHVVHEQPYQAIVDTAAKNACDLILMASHGRRGVAAIALESETVKVLTHSTIPVFVFRAPHYSPLSVDRD